jgi:hypothetical protein
MLAPPGDADAASARLWCATTEAPSCGAVRLTAGGGGEFTMTAIDAEVVLYPAESVAMAKIG